MFGYTATSIVNIGLLKLGSGAISDLNAPRSDNERRAALVFKHERDLELCRRFWRFGVRKEALSLKGTTDADDDGFRYTYQYPNGCLVPIQNDRYPFKNIGDELWSPIGSGFKLEWMAQSTEDKFHPLFAEVLAFRIALTLCEASTQSGNKKDSLRADAKDLITEAYRINAIFNPKETTTENTDAFTWVGAAFDP